MSIILLLVIILLIILLTLASKYLKDGNKIKKTAKQEREEQIVCRDVAEIYCSMINFINELCGINNQAINELEKFLSTMSINKNIDTYQLTSLENAVNFRIKEVNELSATLPSFKLNLLPSGKAILAKHKLSEVEVSCAEMNVKQSINEVISNFLYLQDSIKGNQFNTIEVNFALARLKCFQYESNAVYYGALEGLCSFPIESLDVYYEVSPRWDNLPKGVTLRSMKKEGFKMHQELEFNKAQQCIDAANELINAYGNDVDSIIADLKRRAVNFFVAGSKSLQEERDVFAGVVNILQSKWKPLGIDVSSYSYQNFPREVTDIPPQEQYNNFIAKHVNAAIFILSGKAGAYTKEEFDVAYNNFKKNGTPKILVYSLNNGSNYSDSYIHQKMREEKQYWIEFKDVNELRLLLNIDLETYILDAYTETIKKM